jgi:hypothetical protein
MLDRKALLPLMAKLICREAVLPALSVTTNSGPYVPWPPISVLVIWPVAAASESPSGSGG